jgi:Putative peptidoglycan binding domain
MPLRLRTPYHFHGYRPRFRYGRRFYGRHWPYRWHWLHRPEGPISSPFVAWAQRVLAQVFGPIVPQDGVFGPETRRFVEQFQAQQGLPVTGDLDDATVAALQAAVGPELTPPIQWRLEPGIRHPEGPELPMPRPEGREPAMPNPGRAAPRPPPTPISAAAPRPAMPPSSSQTPPHSHHPHPPGPPEPGEQGELAPGPAESAQRGRWIRYRGRIILMGA